MLQRSFNTPIYQDPTMPSRQRRKPTERKVFAFHSVLMFALLTVLTVYAFSLYWTSPGNHADGRRRLFNVDETVWSLWKNNSYYGMRGTVLDPSRAANVSAGPQESHQPRSPGFRMQGTDRRDLGRDESVLILAGKHKGKHGKTLKWLKKRGKWGVRLDTGELIACSTDSLQKDTQHPLGQVLVKFENDVCMNMNERDITKCPKPFYPEGSTVRCHRIHHNRPCATYGTKSNGIDPGVVVEWANDDVNEVRIRFDDGAVVQWLPGDWIVGAAAVKPKPEHRPARRPTTPDYDYSSDDWMWRRNKKWKSDFEVACARLAEEAGDDLHKRSKKKKRKRNWQGKASA